MNIKDIQKTILLLFPHWNYHVIYPTQNILKTDMSLEMYYALRVLRLEGAINMTQFAKYLYLSKDKMSKLANRLSEYGFIEREIAPADRRLIKVNLTEKGIAYIDNFLEENADCYRGFLDKLTPEQCKRFWGAANELLAVFEEVATQEEN